ncbi:unnamed protein product [Rangifer tarandus platyrhynchus]|uniref:Uncharacterized protein n=2 Tax=Rangifer tarandus platyrhynchus TaxID=3082113 RepID=A0ABN8ZX68_RANTA|nr:unnamed protein product [Rangifer tarandus platyrhynchus]
MGAVSLPGQAEGLGVLAGAAQGALSPGTSEGRDLRECPGWKAGVMVPSSPTRVTAPGRPRLSCHPGPAQVAVTSGAQGMPCGAAALLRLPRDQTPTPSIEPFLLQGPRGPGAECFLLLQHVFPVVD